MSDIKIWKIFCNGYGRPRIIAADGRLRDISRAVFSDSIGQHLALLPKGFNPETDEAIVVKKDARRVWIEQVSNLQCCHEHRPQWDRSVWVSDGGQLFPLGESQL